MAKTSTFLKDKDKVAVEEKFTMRKERAVIYKQGQSEEGTQSSHSPTADILGCEVKRTLRSITMTKASGGDGIPAELFQTLKDDAVKVLHLICQQIWKTQQCHKTDTGQFSFQYQRRTMPKNVQTTAQLHLFHNLARSCSKFSKLVFNST